MTPSKSLKENVVDNMLMFIMIFHPFKKNLPLCPTIVYMQMTCCNAKWIESRKLLILHAYSNDTPFPQVMDMLWIQHGMSSVHPARQSMTSYVLLHDMSLSYCIKNSQTVHTSSFRNLDPNKWCQTTHHTRSFRHLDLQQVVPNCSSHKFIPESCLPASHAKLYISWPPTSGVELFITQVHSGILTSHKWCQLYITHVHSRILAHKWVRTTHQTSSLESWHPTGDIKLYSKDIKILWNCIG